MFIFCFPVKRQAFGHPSDFILTPRNPVFPFLPVIASFITFRPSAKAPPELTFLHDSV